MRTDAFDYELPEERIAQRPVEERDLSRLMILRRDGSEPIGHAVFRDLPRLLDPEDLLVLNDTRVIAARLQGRKDSGGRIELLLVERAPADPQQAEAGDALSDDDVWLCMAGFSRAPRAGARFFFDPALRGIYLGTAPGGLHRVRLEADGAGGVPAALHASAQVPLPPYIHRNGTGPVILDDAGRYQTVYAAHEGAIAAPTAGLHFTRPLLDALVAAGLRTAFVTLHVGPATFLPVRSDDLEDHAMPGERYEVPKATVEAVRRARSLGRRVVAVGTTVVRALESASDSRGGIVPARGRTDLFILPGHRFRVVDALVTNFHLPRSTLLALVAAFAGRERILAAYGEAVARDYRFYSYGDAMLIL